MNNKKIVPRDAWQWGLSCEFLKVEDILALEVPDLMKQYDFGLFLKMYEEDFDETYKKLLEKLIELDIFDHFFPWPCLSIDEGYYPNKHNVDAFTILIDRILDWYEEKNFPPPEYILVDLEPDINPERFEEAERLRAENRLIFQDNEGNICIPETEKETEEDVQRKEKEEKKGGGIMETVGKLIDGIDEMDEEEFMKASKKFQNLVNHMHNRGTKALCVALPMTFDDMKDGKHLLQDFFTTPIQTVKWDMFNYMIFTLPTKNIFAHEDYVHLVYSYCKDFLETHGEKASITFGITGFGKKMGQVNPELYVKEFNEALAAGVTKLGIFCLENVLMLGEKNYRAFFNTINTANGDFTPDEEKLKFANMVRRIFEGLDYIAPALLHLVKSGRAMQLIQKAIGGF